LTGLTQKPTVTLPSSVTSIKLDAAQMHVFKPGDIPVSDGLKALDLGVNGLSAAGFERLSGVVLTLPTLTHLLFPSLTLDQLQAITHLPPNLNTLHIGCKGTPMPLPHLRSVWPQSLTSLTLRSAIDTPFHTLNLPTSLLHLTMKGRGAYRHPLTPLPPYLQTLRVWTESIHPPDTRTHPFPHSLTNLDLGSSATSTHSWREVSLPPKLRTLDFYINCERDGDGHEADDEHEHEHDDGATDDGLPHNTMNHPTLTDLSVPPSLDEPMHSLPPSLTKLDLGREFNQPLDAVEWRSGLKTLILSRKWNQPGRRLKLPDSLTGVSHTHTRRCNIHIDINGSMVCTSVR